MIASSGGAFDDVKAPRAALDSAVESHGEEEYAVLARLACGFVGALVTRLVPDLRVCLQLASDYEGKDALQFDLDDL